MDTDAMQALRELEQGVPVVAHVEPDADGYLDRRCPFPECGTHFKVHGGDFQARNSEETAFCIFCRHGAHPSQFVTPEQFECLKEVATNEFVTRIAAALRPAIEAVNNAPPNLFFRIHLDLRTPSVGPVIPPAALELMKVRTRCRACGYRVAFVGAAFFCHACGDNSAERTFDQTIARIRKVIAKLDSVLVDQDADTAREFELHVVEKAVPSLVTAFQRLAEILYPKLPAFSGMAPRRNAFQNLTEGSDLWSGAGGRAYVAILDASEMEDVRRSFQQRHVLQHLDGIVDVEYVQKSGDTTYEVGQRLVVKREAVLRMADGVEKLAAGLRADAT